MRRALALLIGLAALLATPAAAHAAKAHMTVLPSPVPGAQRLHFEYGPVHVEPGPERHPHRRQRPDAAGGGLHRRLPAEPDADDRKRHDPARRPDPPAPRGLARQQPAAAVGRGRGEDATSRRRRGYGWHYRPTDRWFLNHMIHNLTPSPDGRVHHLRHRLHPDDLAGRAGDARRPDAVGRRRWAASPTRCSTPSWAPAATTGATPTRTSRRPDRATRSTRCVVPARRRARRHRRAPAPRRPLHRSRR